MTALAQKLKFEPIVHLEEAIRRDRLTLQILDAPPSSARLGLVLAPAGFGKTTVLAQIAATLSAAGERVAWLNCHPQDREPGLFIEDLGRAWDAAGVTGLAVGMGVAEMCHALASHPERVTLFVDRYEMASSSDVDTLLASLAVLLPLQARCIVASRVPPCLPLTQMQLDGQLRVVDVDPLRFTDAEARDLLRATLPNASMQLIIDRAAGWPFVLQLARLRMAAGGGAPILDAGQAALPTQEVFEYLATQVFSSLRADDVEFLVDVAILESIDIASANAVRNRSDSASHIERLALMKPIVVVNSQPLTASLHPLLRDFLRSMLERADEGGRAATLHTRAAQHFAERGALHDAVTHAALGGRFELAARVLADAGGIALIADQGVGRVKTLLQLLPPGTVQKYPRLRLMRIFQLLIEENGPEARLDFDRLTSGLDLARAPELHDEYTRLDFTLTRLLMSVNEAEHVFRFAVPPELAEVVTQARTRYCEDSRYLVLALAVEILMLQRYGPLERAERRAAEAERLHEEGHFSYNIPWTWIYKARNAYARGRLDEAATELLRASGKELDIFTFTHGSFGQMVHALLGKLRYDQGALDEAFKHFEAIVPVRLMTLFEIHAGAYVYYPLCEFARGNASRALEMLAQARQIAFDDNLPHLDILASAHEIQILIATNRLAEANALAQASRIEHVHGIGSEAGALPSIEAEAVAAACFHLALANDRVEQASQMADAALAAARRAGRRLPEIDAQLMSARAALARPNGAAAARQSVEQALRLAESSGVVQAFLWAGADILPVLRGIATAARPESAWAARIVTAWEDGFQVRSAAELLFTPRERDVLRGLVKGQSTKLIARDLVLSPETIKHHLKAIFSKLAVRSRDDAVIEARRRTLV
jgi:LuxR family transcriptional regulator, maltose regulon positive regulatory protein